MAQPESTTGELQVIIERCRNCLDHGPTVRHYGPLYDSLCDQLTDAVNLLYPDALVTHNDETLRSMLKIPKAKFPRLGAFEVYARVGTPGSQFRCLFSKLESQKWPDLEMLVQSIEEIGGEPAPQSLLRSVAGPPTALLKIVSDVNRSVVKQLLKKIDPDGDKTFVLATPHSLITLTQALFTLQDWEGIGSVLCSLMYVWQKVSHIGLDALFADFQSARSLMAGGGQQNLMMVHWQQWLQTNASVIERNPNSMWQLAVSASLQGAEKYQRLARVDATSVSRRVRRIVEAMPENAELVEAVVELHRLQRRLNLFDRCGLFMLMPDCDDMKASLRLLEKHLPSVDLQLAQAGVDPDAFEKEYDGMAGGCARQLLLEALANGRQAMESGLSANLKTLIESSESKAKSNASSGAKLSKKGDATIPNTVKDDDGSVYVRVQFKVGVPQGQMGVIGKQTRQRCSAALGISIERLRISWSHRGDATGVINDKDDAPSFRVGAYVVLEILAANASMAMSPTLVELDRNSKPDQRSQLNSSRDSISVEDLAQRLQALATRRDPLLCGGATDIASMWAAEREARDEAPVVDDLAAIESRYGEALVNLGDIERVGPQAYLQIEFIFPLHAWSNEEQDSTQIGKTFSRGLHGELVAAAGVSSEAMSLLVQPKPECAQAVIAIHQGVATAVGGPEEIALQLQRLLVDPTSDLRMGAICRHAATAVCSIRAPMFTGNDWANANVYISATAPDMVGERRLLHSVILPALRDLCVHRQLRLDWIDPRCSTPRDKTGILADLSWEPFVAMRTLQRCALKPSHSLGPYPPLAVVILGDSVGWIPPDRGSSDISGAPGLCWGCGGRRGSHFDVRGRPIKFESHTTIESPSLTPTPQTDAAASVGINDNLKNEAEWLKSKGKASAITSGCSCWRPGADIGRPRAQEVYDWLATESPWHSGSTVMAEVAHVLYRNPISCESVIMIRDSTQYAANNLLEWENVVPPRARRAFAQAAPNERMPANCKRVLQEMVQKAGQSSVVQPHLLPRICTYSPSLSRYSIPEPWLAKSEAMRLRDVARNMEIRRPEATTGSEATQFANAVGLVADLLEEADEIAAQAPPPRQLNVSSSPSDALADVLEDANVARGVVLGGLDEFATSTFLQLRRTIHNRVPIAITTNDLPPRPCAYLRMRQAQERYLYNTVHSTAPRLLYVQAAVKIADTITPPRSAAVTALEDAIAGPGMSSQETKMLILLGPSGSGRSTCAAQIVEQIRSYRPRTHPLFVFARPWHTQGQILNYLLGMASACGRRTGEPLQEGWSIPNSEPSPSMVANAIKHMVDRIPATQAVVIVIDGLTGDDRMLRELSGAILQLVPRRLLLIISHEHLIHPLPLATKSNAQLGATKLSSRVEIARMPPLSLPEAKATAKAVLKSIDVPPTVSTELIETVIPTLVASPGAASPLYCAVAISEAAARVMATEAAGSAAVWEAPIDVDGMVRSALGRLNMSYPGLTHAVLKALWCLPTGLDYVCLESIVSVIGWSVESGAFCSFIETLRPWAISEGNGHVIALNRSIRQVVEEMYLQVPESPTQASQMVLADFQSRPSGVSIFCPGVGSKLTIATMAVNGVVSVRNLADVNETIWSTPPGCLDVFPGVPIAWADGATLVGVSGSDLQVHRVVATNETLAPPIAEMEIPKQIRQQLSAVAATCASATIRAAVAGTCSEAKVLWPRIGNGRSDEVSLSCRGVMRCFTFDASGTLLAAGGDDECVSIWVIPTKPPVSTTVDMVRESATDKNVSQALGNDQPIRPLVTLWAPSIRGSHPPYAPYGFGQGRAATAAPPSYARITAVAFGFGSRDESAPLLAATDACGGVGVWQAAHQGWDQVDSGHNTTKSTNATSSSPVPTDSVEETINDGIKTSVHETSPTSRKSDGFDGTEQHRGVTMRLRVRLDEGHGQCLTFSPNSSWLAVGSSTGHVAVFELDSSDIGGWGRLLFKVSVGTSPSSYGVTCVSFDAPGAEMLRVATAGEGAGVVAIEMPLGGERLTDSCSISRQNSESSIQRPGKGNREPFVWNRPTLPPKPPRKEPPLVIKVREILSESDAKRERIAEDALAARQWVRRFEVQESERLDKEQGYRLEQLVEIEDKNRRMRRAAISARKSREREGRPDPYEYAQMMSEKRERALQEKEAAELRAASEAIRLAAEERRKHAALFQKSSSSNSRSPKKSGRQ